MKHTKSPSFVEKKDKKNKKIVPRKKRNQSLKDYLYKLNKGCCTYCQDKFKIEELCLIRKNHKWNGFIEPLNNKVIACKTCSSKKSNMNHREFFQYLYRERMKLRDEILLNYHSFANKIFKRYHHKCIYCEFEYGYTPKDRKRKLTLDHKRSLMHHGSNDEKNLAPACLQHNKEKSAMSPEQFFNYLEKQGRKFNIKFLDSKNKIHML